jgi:hypothetical protein
MSDVTLRDGSTNNGANVTTKNRLATVSFTESLSYANIVKHAQGYMVPISALPVTGANDEFWYFYNGASTDAIIRRILLTDAGAEVIILASCTGTAAGGAAIATSVNLRAGSANTIAIKSAANIIYGGVDVTGLTLVATLDSWTTAAGVLSDRDYSRGPVIVVPPATAVCLSAVTGTANITGAVYLEWADEPIGWTSST